MEFRWIKDSSKEAIKGKIFNKDEQIYNMIPISREWLIIHCVVNVEDDYLPRFYIIRGKRIKDDYIKH